MEIYVNDRTTPTNDKTLFEYFFATYNKTQLEADPYDFKELEAVPCVELLPKLYSQEESDRMIKQIYLGGYSDNYLCPNAT